MSERPPKSAREPLAASAERTYAAMLERQRLQSLVETATHPAVSLTHAGGEVWYLLDRRPHGGGRVGGARARPGCIGLSIGIRKRDAHGGALGRVTQLGKLPAAVPANPVESLVCALARADAYGMAWLDAQSCSELLPGLCATGRVAQLLPESEEPALLSWDDGDPWRLQLRAERPVDQPELVQLSGVLRHEGVAGEEELALSQVDAVLAAELFICRNKVCRVERGYGRWLKELHLKPLSVPAADVGWFVQQLSQKPYAPQIQNIGVMGFALDVAKPKSLLRLSLPKKAQQLIRGELLFKYGKRVFGADPDQNVAVREEQAAGSSAISILRRDYDAETRAVQQLQDAGFVVELTGAAEKNSRPAFAVRIALPDFALAADEALALGFSLEAEGQAVRRGTAFSPIIDSEQDWFCLKGNAEFQGKQVELPALLHAVRQKTRWVRLGDGSLGWLPEAWLNSLVTLAQITTPSKKGLRFHASQALLLGAATDALPNLQVDPAFTQLRNRLAEFSGTAPVLEPASFCGALRPYQRQALGWISALDELGFSGCLADDMGLGKTVVVAAWLLVRHALQGAKRTALLVVPRSLLFNWQVELQRFAPSLKLLVHHGSGRRPPDPEMHGFDVVLTSYGTLRSDASAFAELTFDYVVLDEAHRIKNRASDTFRAAQGLSSHARLALTGTPLENHLGEVWTLLSYLNPGLFVHQEALQKTFERKRPSDVALEQVILKAVRPFVLRRTKSDVAPELPARVEKTLFVTLSKAERRKYDELAAFYRGRIIEDRKIRRKFGAGRNISGGNGKGAAQALEALLRLRQASCHLGLLDDSQKELGSAKTDLLIEQLLALQAEGHKALVFSQFTQLLELLETKLSQAGLQHVTLTGQTRDRQAAVEAFQSDPALSVFLISLKAGGVGLNLVAADYVFILDPWWNPASEAQAIDRAHRIGQERPVMAYRLLCKDTVEEKVAALQEKKRQLAAELFEDSAAFSSGLSQEDLEALLLG